MTAKQSQTPTTRYFKLPRGPGQPTKLTPKTKETLFQALLGGCTIKDACLYAQISVSTYESWMKRAEKDKAAGKDSQYVQFMEEAMRVRDQAKPRLEMILAKAAETDPRIALAILERRYPAEWGRRQFIETKQQIEGRMDLGPEDLSRKILHDPEARGLARKLVRRLCHGEDLDQGEPSGDGLVDQQREVGDGGSPGTAR